MAIIALQDLRLELTHAARRLRRSPGFTVVVALTLAVGIGGATTLFSVVHSVLLRPLPFPESEKLVRIYETNRELSIEETGAATGNVLAWRKRAPSFSGIAGFYVMGRTLQSDAGVEVLRAAQVTEDFFPVMRVQAALGRTVTAEETQRSVYNNAAAPVGTDLVAVISHKLWRRHFGGNAGIVGQTVMIDRKPWKIIGVMPESFQFPTADVDVWLPWGFREAPPHDQRYLQAIARIGGATPAQAEGELQSVAAQLADELPTSNKGWSVKLVPLQTAVTGKSGATLWLLFAAVCCVLLIGCANVAHLQWIRAGQFQHETAVRMALGASPGRLLQQFGAESALLAAAGGTGGVLLSFAALQWLRWAQPAQLPRASEVSVHPLALLFAALVTLGAAAVAGLAPALGWRRTDLAPALREGTRNSSTSRAAHRARNALVVAEVAVAAMLLVIAGLLGRSLQQLFAVDPGFQARNVLVLPIFLDNNHYTTGAKTRAYYAALLEKLSALPGVVSAGGSTALPASPLGPDFERPVWAEGTQGSPSDALRADVRMVTPDYFRTLQIPLLRGRGFGAEDSPEAPRVIVVNEALARAVWPGEDAVGKQLVVDYSTAGTYPFQIVGVVGNVRFYGLRSEPQPEIFLPHAQRSYLVMNIALRATGDPRPLIPAVRRAALEVDPGMPPQSIKPLEDLLRDTVAQDRLATALFASFSGVALFLAMLGIYGVIAYRTAQRTNEIGIRMALGAAPGTIVRMVISSGVSLAAVGAAAGLALAAGSSRWVQSMLFGIAPLDVRAFFAAAVAIVLIAIAACWIPARRAARVDPVDALRHT